MKALAVALLMFPLGVGAAWLVKSASPELRTPSRPQPGQAKSEVERGKPARPSSKVPVAEADRNRLKEILPHIGRGGLGHPTGERQSAPPELTAKDFPGVLEALRERAGLTGLPWDAQEAFKRLLQDWYGLDAGRAAAWVRGLESNRDKMTYGGLLVNEALKNDYDEAVRLMLDFSVNDHGVVQIPEPLMTRAVELGAAELIELLAYSRGGGGGVGYLLKFPEEFDFAAAVDGISALHAKGIHPATYPGNLLREWASRDREAAVRRAAAGAGIPFGLGLSAYFSDLESPEDLADSLAIIADVDNPTPQIFTDVAYALNVEHENQVGVVLAALPAEVDQLKVRGGLLGATNYQGDGLDDFRTVLLADLTPAERVQLVEQAMTATDEHGWNQESRDALARTLVNLGHPEEQMATLIPKAPESAGPRWGIVSGVSFGSGFVDDDVTWEDSETDGEADGEADD